MEQNENQYSQEMMIDIGELINTFIKKWKLIAIATILCGLLSFFFTVLFIDKQYESEASIYIIPKVNNQGTIDYSTLQSDSKMVNNYIEIMKGDIVLGRVADELKLESKKYLKENITISNKYGTEIIKISAITEDSKLSQEIVSSIVDTFSKEIKDILNVNEIMILNEPTINEEPVSPNNLKNLLVGLIFGFIVSSGIVFVLYLLDNRLKNQTDVENYLGVPVLACVSLERGRSNESN